jgi:hypothetical protein
MRAADVWESPRFTGIFWLGVFFGSQALSTLRPHAANASRWGADLRNSESIYILMKVHELADYRHVKVKSALTVGSSYISISSSSRVFHFVVFSSLANVPGQSRCTFPSRILASPTHPAPSVW